ncbi:unnamed protein product [Ectocarpus sp. 6 AP-2014]
MLAWNQLDLVDEGGDMFITLSARGIEAQGMITIGFGGLSMETTDDFVIYVVESETSVECTHQSGPGGRSKPPPDDEENNELEVVRMSVEGQWTGVTFARSGKGTDDSDYPLSDNIYLSQYTSIIYAWRSGDGIGKQPQQPTPRPTSTMARSLTSSALTRVTTTLSTAPCCWWRG